MRNMNRHMIEVMVASAAFIGCTTVAPEELLQARQAYAQSNTGPAATLAPNDLRNAKLDLDRANKEFDEHGNTERVRDYAYISARRVELADARARTEQDRRTIAAEVKAGVGVRDAQVKESREALAATRDELKDARRDRTIETSALRAANEAQGKDLERSAIDLDTERQGRLSAENRLAGAMKDLTAVAAVKEDARGVVITLSGSVLFVSGKYELLHTAETKLEQVAAALMAEPEGKRIVVEGHTDSRGSDAINQPLSLSRANAVRDFLIGRGVAANKISAMGLGSSRPLVDNDTAENRANNRRVEIVVGEPKVSER
jgi:outer membrane protein OmpA-like peptidoglycan-associated protein